MTGPGALSEDGGRSWVVLDGDGHYLRCWFAGEPDWCKLKSNARRYTAEDAAAQVCKLQAVAVQAHRVVA